VPRKQKKRTKNTPARPVRSSGASDERTLCELCLSKLHHTTDDARNFHFELTHGAVSIVTFPRDEDRWLSDSCEAVQDFGEGLYRLGYGRKRVATVVDKSWSRFEAEFRRLVGVVGRILQDAANLGSAQPGEAQKPIQAAESTFLGEFARAKDRAKLPIHLRQGLKRKDHTARAGRLGQENTVAKTSPDQGFPHADDFSWIELDGKRHLLNPRKAGVFSILSEAGHPFELPQAAIMARAGTPNSQLRDTFKRSGLWGRLLKFEPRKRTVRLTAPPAPNK
jgi:hypothetical protein